jgi:Amt family ammonium transporter
MPETALNIAWVLLSAFLIFFMQAGFALVETGLCRAKNAAHTMALNVVIFGLGAAGFWAVGYALMFGGHALPPTLGASDAAHHEFVLQFGERDFGLFGFSGFFLAGRSLDSGLLAFFFFQLMFMDTAATIPTGALAERWKFISFVCFGLFISAIIYPIYGNWVWGGGWLSKLGTHFGLGHGVVDFAGSSVVHMVGGFTALAGAYKVGPRLGKYRPDGTANPLPAHSVPLYMLGTLILTFGWFGFNAGSTLSALDPNIARIAVNTALAAAAGGLSALLYLWLRYGKPDPSFLCNGILAGLVSITASCAYVAPWAAFVIGAAAGLLVIGGCFLVERKLRVDDPCGAVSVHGISGLWGMIALGLFADGTNGDGLHGVPGNVTGLFYGGATQLPAQVIGVLVNLCWVLPTAYGFFWVVGRLLGNRVSAHSEFVGLDLPEMGALGYITQDPKVPEGRVLVPLPVEPRAAQAPPRGLTSFSLFVEGVEAELLMRVWSDLCQVGEQPPPAEFKAIYPFMTTVSGTRFRFRGGDPLAIRGHLERLLQDRLKGRSLRVRLEG